MILVYLSIRKKSPVTKNTGLFNENILIIEYNVPGRAVVGT